MRLCNFDGYGPDGRRLYHKGGGDGGAGDMRRQEQERQIRVRDATQRINDIFTGGPAHKRGTNLLTDPGAVKVGGTYYDASGNPTLYDVPGGGSGLGRALSFPLMKQAFLDRGVYSGAEDVPESQGFDDKYFNGIADAYTKFQQPLLDEQSAAARRELPYAFSSTDSSEYIRKHGELERDIERQGAQIRDQGVDFANKQRAGVEQNRSDLVQMANAGTDAGTVAQIANTRAQALAKPPVFTPISDLFAKYTALAANASQQQPVSQSPLLFNRGSTMYNAPSNGSSVSYVP